MHKQIWLAPEKIFAVLLTYIEQKYVHGGDIHKALNDKTEFDFVLTC